MVQKYRDQPIISILSGYQRYIGRRNNHKVDIFSRKSGRTELYNLYKVYGRGATKGSYIGNHMMISHYSPVGYISETQSTKLDAAFVGQFAQKSQNTLGKITNHYKSGKAFKKIKVSRVPAAEEQTKAVGGTIPKKEHKHAQPVDIQNKFGNQQVTVSRLNEKYAHHGIYGTGGDNLKSRIESIRAQASPDGMTDRDLQRVADAGLQYFQGRLPQWNTILSKIQPADGKANTLRSYIHRSTKVAGTGFFDAQAQGLKGMMAGSSGFFHEGAAALTQTALGNMKQFGKGVSYSFTIDPFKHAVLQKFIMQNKNGKFQWDVQALNKASVVEGYMSTDEQYRVIGGYSSKYDAASRRAFAQTAYRANKDVETTEIMKMHTAATGALGKNKNLLPHIDMLHADKQLARYIKNGLIKDMQKTTKEDAKSFSKQIMGVPEEILGVLDRGSNSALAWAAPYVGFSDYSYEAFEV